MLKDSLKPGFPRESAVKALGVWLAILSGSDLFAERSAHEIDDKIYMLRPYVFAPHYELLYANWEYRKLPLCKPGCSEHPPISGTVTPYKRFGHKHMRAPPHFFLGAILIFLKLLDRQPARVGLKQGSTSFQGDIGRGLFSITRIMPSIYHDTEWQRNTVCQDPHTSPGLSSLTFHGRLQGFWRGNLLFFDFDAYRQMLAGNMGAMYTGTFAQHAVELEIKETVIRVRNEDVGGKGSLLNAGFADEETEEEQGHILSGYGYEVLTGDAVYAREALGWTKEILLSGVMRSAWGIGRVRGRIRAWDGLVTLAVGVAVSRELRVVPDVLLTRVETVPRCRMGVARLHSHRRILGWPMARHVRKRGHARVRGPVRFCARRRSVLPQALPDEHDGVCGRQQTRLWVEGHGPGPGTWRCQPVPPGAAAGTRRWRWWWWWWWWCEGTGAQQPCQPQPQLW
jgi:hypothetical protein